MEPTTWIIADSHKFEQNFSFFSNFQYLSYVCPRSGKIPICFSALNSRVIDTSCGARRFPELAEGGGHQSAAAETQTGETQYRTLIVIAQNSLVIDSFASGQTSLRMLFSQSGLPTVNY